MIRSLTTIISITFFFVLFISCGTQVENEVKKPKQKTNKPVSKKSVSKKENVLSRNEFWALAKKDLKLTPVQITKLKKININYVNKVKKLRKDKKWYGTQNTSIRKKASQDKVKAMKNVLKNKYSKWVVFKKKNVIK